VLNEVEGKDLVKRKLQNIYRLYEYTLKR